MGISSGSLDGDSPLTLATHIYVDEAGAYYDLDNEAKQFTREVWLRGGWRRFRRE